MAVRDATRRESPDSHVLYIEDLRRHLGIISSTDDSTPSADTPKTCPEVILIGHDMHGDFLNMERDDIDLRKSFHYSGCLDTAVILEDTGAHISKSLSSLVSRYDLAELEWKNPGCDKVPGRYSFVGSHCAGNDAIKTLEASLSQALDLSVQTRYHKSVDEPKLANDWLSEPLRNLNTNLILLAYDTESVETPRYKPKVLNRTSEHGFAWLRLADIAHVAPGDNACNWRSFICARHWINQDFRNFKNWFYCVGNPMGFWPEYGKSRYYRVSEGPAAFHRMFKEIADFAAGCDERSESVRGVTALLDETTLVGKSADNENESSHIRGNRLFSRGGRGRFRGNPGRGRGGRMYYGGGSLDNSGSSVRGNGNSRGRPRGNGRGTYTRGRGNFGEHPSEQSILPVTEAGTQTIDKQSETIIF